MRLQWIHGDIIDIDIQQICLQKLRENISDICVKSRTQYQIYKAREQTEKLFLNKLLVVC